MTRTFARYVAIGDSTTEGLDDPDGHGSYRGWANRFAEAIALHQGHLLYANLAVRGLKTREILDTQLTRALEMHPDLCTVVSGTNDVLRRHFDHNAYRRNVQHMQSALIEQGATLLTFTLPDLSAIMLSARLVASRIAVMNDVLRDVSGKTGAIVVDLAMHEVAADRRLWSRDRLHANALGHARIAAALADAIALTGSSKRWSESLGPASPRGAMLRVKEEWHWTRDYLAPWIVRRLQGTSSADGVVCKQPELTAVNISELPSSTRWYE
jgi:lysophospholipase L1-like esterase